MPILLDHSIVGQSATTLTIRKDREFAACRLCGDIFQPWINIEASDEEYEAHPEIAVAAAIEIRQWRSRHNAKHSERERRRLHASGLTFTPEAAIRLAPFGLVPIGDAEDVEIAQALIEAPRAPVNDVDTTLKGYVTFRKDT